MAIIASDWLAGSVRLFDSLSANTILVTKKVIEIKVDIICHKRILRRVVGLFN